MSSEMTPTAQPITTPISDPKRRDFFPQTPRERWRSFCWRWVRRLIFTRTPLSCNALRAWLLKKYGAHLDAQCFVHPKAMIDYPWNLTVGEGAVIRQHVLLECKGPIVIGKGSNVSQYAHLVSGTHDYHRRDMRIETRPIHIGDGVWIAADTFIGPGVTIGDGSIIGARAGVFSDIPANVVAVGSRAKPVRRLDADRNEHEYDPEQPA